MTFSKRLLAATAAAAMLTASTGAAAAGPATALSAPAANRAAAPAQHDAKLGAVVPTGTLISIGILAALVVIVLVATKQKKDGGSPKSP